MTDQAMRARLAEIVNRHWSTSHTAETIMECENIPICYALEAMKAAPSIPDKEHWRGIGKLIEEAGEVLQLIGKVIPFPDGPHPDGKGALRDRLPVELADLKAAIHYFETENHLTIMEDRAADKVRQFTHWGLTGIMDLRAPVLTHGMDCALHRGAECDCGVATRTTGPAPAVPVYDSTQRPIDTSHASMDNEGTVTLHLGDTPEIQIQMENETASTPRGIL